jgi:RHS repeat-associated protein
MVYPSGRIVTGTESLALRFPGQLFDPETGFHQNWHRDYDPTLGRYLQPDPIGLEGGPNPYAYTFGDPVNLIDPEGLQEALVRSLPLAGSAAAADGPLPVGDAIALGLLSGALLYEACTIAWDRFFNDDAFWDSLKPYRQGIRTNGLSGKQQRFYEKDRTHGDLEVYDAQGRHMGSADPETGEMTKPAVPGRRSDKVR